MSSRHACNDKRKSICVSTVINAITPMHNIMFDDADYYRNIPFFFYIGNILHLCCNLHLKNNTIVSIKFFKCK